MRSIGARQRPLVLVAPMVPLRVLADRQPDGRLARDAGVDAAQELLEEAQLHQAAFERVERIDVVADV